MSNKGKVNYVFPNKHQCTAQPPLLLNHFLQTMNCTAPACSLSGLFRSIKHLCQSVSLFLLKHHPYSTVFSNLDCHVSSAICSLLNDWLHESLQFSLSTIERTFQVTQIQSLPILRANYLPQALCSGTSLGYAKWRHQTMPYT